MYVCRYTRLFALSCVALAVLAAAEHRGQVTFGGLPLPGATVSAVQGEKTLKTITDQQGLYLFADLPDGAWTMQVEMLCFAAQKRELTVGAGGQAEHWDLKLLPMESIKSASVPPAPPASPTTTTGFAIRQPNGRNLKNVPPPVANTPSGFQRADLKSSEAKSANPPAESNPAPASDTFGGQSANDLAQRAVDGFLINGAANNGNSSPFALAPAFGNNRKGTRSLYNGNIGFILDNSALDARSFSLTGQDTPKPDYNHLTGVLSFGGPIKIPRLLPNGPNFVFNYQWTRNRNATTQTNLMPTSAERNGDFSQVLDSHGQPVHVLDPHTGAPFAGNIIPISRISPQARALLNLYPLPNFDGLGGYNFQIPIVGASHQDNLQSRANKTIGRRDQISGAFAFQSIRGDTQNLFGFLDTTDTLSLNSGVTWRHNFTTRLFGTAGYQFSRMSVRTKPFFANRLNVSGDAGITGNNQDALNWGPPTLAFSSGIAGLADAQQTFSRNRTGTLAYDMFWSRGRHNLSFGGDFRKQQFNVLAQQDPRGTFTFTGAAAGYDFAGFLLGTPDTSSIAFGNADKYLRASGYDGYVTDDWRISPGLTLNAGVRWEYGSPITELYGRLVNLDIAPGFSAVAPVVASQPVGTLTGARYPDSLIRPDKHAFQPRVAISWRPLPASSMVIRAGYGVYYNTSVYQGIALQMAQQSPLSKSLSVQNSPSNPLTLADGFNVSATTIPNTFAVDPNFLVGYTQNWQISIQRDLPAALIMTATYLGIKGTRGVQEFLPNTYPSGACTNCPTGFAYLTSNGNSTRQAGQFQLRRRLHNGLTATAQYIYSKSIDDAALGGKGQTPNVVAQDWLNLRGERALSNFDQRHLLAVQAQYSTGMGMGGGTLLSGWRGGLFKEWTVSTQITAGSGLPLTPVYPRAVNGTGVTGSIRPDYTGLPVYDAPAGAFLNPLAYVEPAPGRWGNAGRNSITGPSQFVLSGSLGRTFRVGDRMSLDLRIDAANALNHVTFPSWNTTVTSTQFGLPNAANAMRSVQTLLRVRF